MEETVALTRESYRTRVSHAGFTCWSDCIRTDEDHGLVYASLFGQQNSVMALWADIVLQKPMFARTAEGIEFGPPSKAHNRWTRYLSARAPIARGLTHLVVARVEATTQVDLYARHFYTVSAEPSVAWWPVFKRLMPVPVKDSWREALWRLGKSVKGHKRPINKLKGVGLPGYEIGLQRDTWLEIIEHGLKKGDLA